jgi:hypothetical protein
MREPIPFAGWVETEESMDKLLKELTGADPENMPKYVVLGDGTVYFYRKEEDKYALCEQAKTIQERISAAEGSGRTANEKRS